MISGSRSPTGMRFWKLNSLRVKSSNGVCYHTDYYNRLQLLQWVERRRLSGYNTIVERWIKEKCNEQRIGKIKSIGRYTVWNFISYYICLKNIVLQYLYFWRTFAPHFTPFSQTEKCSIPATSLRFIKYVWTPFSDFEKFSHKNINKYMKTDIWTHSHT